MNKDMNIPTKERNAASPLFPGAGRHIQYIIFEALLLAACYRTFDVADQGQFGYALKFVTDAFYIRLGFKLFAGIVGVSACSGVIEHLLLAYSEFAGTKIELTKYVTSIHNLLMWAASTVALSNVLPAYLSLLKYNEQVVQWSSIIFSITGIVALLGTTQFPEFSALYQSVIAMGALLVSSVGWAVQGYERGMYLLGAAVALGSAFHVRRALEGNNTVFMSGDDWMHVILAAGMWALGQSVLSN